MRNLSATYYVYVSYYFGSFFYFASLTSLIGMLLFLAVFFTSAALRDKNLSDSTGRINKVDSGLLVFLTLFFPIFSFNVIRQTTSGSTVLFFSAVAYFGVLYCIFGLFEQLRRKKLRRDWKAFFRLYPFRSPFGAVIRLLLLGNLFYFIFYSFFSFLILFYALTTPISLQHIYISDNMRPQEQLSTSLSVFPSLSYINPNTLTSPVVCVVLLVLLTYIVHFVLGLSEAYENANQEKIRSERFKAELITNVSHDMKTPLTSIVNYVDLLKKLPITDEKFQDYLEVLDRKSLRLKTLTNDLLDASKAGTGNVSVKMQPVNLTEFVGQIVGEFDEDYSARDLTLVYQQPDHEIIVEADVEHLWRVLENIFGNAMKYSLENSRVFARLLADEHQVSLQLVNTSKAPIELTGEELTEQFIRGDKARHTEGSGLGLYIAKSLVELMQADFQILINGDLFEVQLNFNPYHPQMKK
jgi:signal transduction histidine kinase